MVVPGLLAMLLMPLVLYFLYPPEIKQTPNATALAKEHLAAMGPMKREEKIMLAFSWFCCCCGRVFPRCCSA